MSICSELFRSKLNVCKLSAQSGAVQCGICLFFVLMSALVYSPLITAAISGHGGSTQVIARIEQSSDDQSEEPSTESSEPDTSEEESSVTDENPVATGDAFKWFLSAAAVFSVALIIVIGIDRKDPADNTENNG